jgi:hypothetical protein
MISKEQRSKLKKYLKGAYTQDVLKKMAERGILSRFGKPYSGKMISHIFNGRFENLKVEKALIDVYKDRKEAFEREEFERNKLLGIPTKKRNNSEI